MFCVGGWVGGCVCARVHVFICVCMCVCLERERESSLQKLLLSLPHVCCRDGILRDHLHWQQEFLPFQPSYNLDFPQICNSFIET